MGRSYSPDVGLITLVPSDAAMVAGIGAPTLQGQQPSTFLLVTPNSVADLNDFLALSGVDDTDHPARVPRRARIQGSESLAPIRQRLKPQFDSAPTSRGLSSKKGLSHSRTKRSGGLQPQSLFRFISGFEFSPLAGFLLLALQSESIYLVGPRIAKQKRRIVRVKTQPTTGVPPHTSKFLHIENPLLVAAGDGDPEDATIIC